MRFIIPLLVSAEALAKGIPAISRTWAVPVTTFRHFDKWARLPRGNRINSAPMWDRLSQIPMAVPKRTLTRMMVLWFDPMSAEHRGDVKDGGTYLDSVMRKRHTSPDIRRTSNAKSASP
jgi:hypothetical protein